MNKAILAIPLFFLLLAHGGEQAFGQGVDALFQGRTLMPSLLAGPRDPSTSFNLLFVSRNPNAHGQGVEAEVSIGTSLPVFLLGGRMRAKG